MLMEPRVVHSYCFVFGAACQAPPRERREGKDAAAVGAEGPEETAAALRVPKPHRLVARGARHRGAPTRALPGQHDEGVDQVRAPVLPDARLACLALPRTAPRTQSRQKARRVSVTGDDGGL